MLLLLLGRRSAGSSVCKPVAAGTSSGDPWWSLTLASDTLGYLSPWTTLKNIMSLAWDRLCSSVCHSGSCNMISGGLHLLQLMTMDGICSGYYVLFVCHTYYLIFIWNKGHYPVILPFLENIEIMTSVVVEIIR